MRTVFSGRGWAFGEGGSMCVNVRFNATAFLNDRVGWQKQRSGVSTDLFDVKFVSAGEGWAVGAECTVLHTRDGGVNWISERTPTPHTLERNFFTDRITVGLSV